MALGAQWYILFNTIAGAQGIPTELREMAANMRLRGWRRWQELIIPGLFPPGTGGITAAGGAWNASIVSEVVSWGHTTLTATPTTGLTGALPAEPRFPPLPHARAAGISGLLEVLVDRGGPTTATSSCRACAWRWATCCRSRMPRRCSGLRRSARAMSPSRKRGVAFAGADILRSKDLFRQQALAHVPLVATIYQTLQQKEDGTMRDAFFLDVLDEYYPQQEVERQFATAVEWGRYAELFEYDADDGRLRLAEVGAPA